ncbi:MAG TPA: flagellar biosynthetic protein FliQ [Oligoflexia bacterium]|nr:flagellar biosynthetic protein FliQ [Oligoflexia bacterium]HMP27649.1 flagellar biosynthetic protein FliQ [Oligoflexia bacterium]
MEFELLKNALKLIIIMTALPVGLAVLVGGLISIVQAALQAQEQGLIFAGKLGVVILVIVIKGSTALAILSEFTRNCFQYIPKAFF